jgi:hypothetical protein
VRIGHKVGGSEKLSPKGIAVQETLGNYSARRDRQARRTRDDAPMRSLKLLRCLGSELQ